MDEANQLTQTRDAETAEAKGSSVQRVLCVSHDFQTEYYGWRCSKCGVFYPNTAPLGAWLNGETYDGQDNDCEESDPR